MTRGDLTGRGAVKSSDGGDGPPESKTVKDTAGSVPPSGTLSEGTPVATGQVSNL